MSSSSWPELILKIVEEETSSSEVELSDLGLSVEAKFAPPLVTEVSDVELSVTLWRGSDLVTFFEGFVISDGRPSVSEDSAREWIRKSFRQMLDEVRQGEWA